MQLVSFGRVSLEGSTFSRPKPLLLLAYVTLEGPQDRRRLAALFWQGGGAKALSNLSVVLAQFRREGATRVFPDRPGLNPLPSLVGCDATAFLEALEEGDRERALGLYRGPFLHDLGLPLEALDVSDELLDWVLERRESFAHKAQAAMLERAEDLLGRQQVREARGLAERAYALPGAPEPEPALLSRVQRLLAGTGSDLRTRAGSEAQASLEDLSPAAQRVFTALALQERPNLTIVRGALALPLGELSQARETLILAGLIDADNRVLAEGAAQGWLEAHPGERLPLLLSLARATPPQDAFGLYQHLHESTQGFGGVGDFTRARTAFNVRTRRLLDGFRFAEAAALLEQLRSVERVVEAEPDPQGRFQEAYALERLGRFKDALEVLDALPEALHDPDISALRSVLLWRRGLHREAQEVAERVLEGSIQRLWAKATAHNTLGYVAHSAGRFREAASSFKKAAALFQMAGAKDRWVGSLNNHAIELDKIAQESERRGKDPTALESARADAEEAYHQALEALDGLGDSPLLRARILLNLGFLWEQRKDWLKAETYYVQALPFAEAAEALEITARLQLNLGYLHLVRHNPAEARDALSSAGSLAARAGELFIQGVAMAYTADLDDDPDTLEVALTLMEQSNRPDRVGEFLAGYEAVLKRLITKARWAGHQEKVWRLEARLNALDQEHRPGNHDPAGHTRPQPL